eukprot:9486439-Pyramimonas_sp.AAC.1
MDAATGSRTESLRRSLYWSGQAVIRKGWRDAYSNLRVQQSNQVHNTSINPLEHVQYLKRYLTFGHGRPIDALLGTEGDMDSEEGRAPTQLSTADLHAVGDQRFSTELAAAQKEAEERERQNTLRQTERQTVQQTVRGTERQTERQAGADSGKSLPAARIEYLQASEEERRVPVARQPASGAHHQA